MATLPPLLSPEAQRQFARYLAALTKVEAEETPEEFEERKSAMRLKSSMCATYRKLDALLASDWQPEESANV